MVGDRGLAKHVHNPEDLEVHLQCWRKKGGEIGRGIEGLGREMEMEGEILRDC